MKLESNESHWSIVTFGASGKGVCDSLPKHNETHDSIKRQRKYTQKATFRIKYLMKLQRPCIYKISLRDAPRLTRKVQFIFIGIASSLVIKKICLDFYDQLRYFANYGPVFQRLVACYKGEEEAVAKIRGSGNDLRDSYAPSFYS